MKVTFWPLSLILSSNFSTMIKPLPVERKSRPKMVWMSLSSSMSSIIKSIGNINLYNFTSTSFIASLFLFNYWSTIKHVTYVIFASSSPNFIKTIKGIRLMISQYPNFCYLDNISFMNLHMRALFLVNPLIGCLCEAS